MAGFEAAPRWIAAGPPPEWRIGELTVVIGAERAELRYAREPVGRRARRPRRSCRRCGGRGSLTLDQLAHRLRRSKSWASRRPGLLGAQVRSALRDRPPGAPRLMAPAYDCAVHAPEPVEQLTLEAPLTTPPKAPSRRQGP